MRSNRLVRAQTSISIQCTDRSRRKHRHRQQPENKKFAQQRSRFRRYRPSPETVGVQNEVFNDSDRTAAGDDRHLVIRHGRHLRKVLHPIRGVVHVQRRSRK